MGFRPSAKLFYGIPIENDSLVSFEDYCQDQDWESQYGCQTVFSGCDSSNEPAIAISESVVSIDWDDGFYPLPDKNKSLLKMNEDTVLVGIWKDQLKFACKARDIEYNESKCGWYMSTYYG